MVEIRFHPEALEDYQLALEWYQARSPKAATRFEQELDRTLASIAASPELSPDYDTETRFALLQRFPFSVVYQPL